MLITLNAQLSTIHAQGTAFGYQGRLNANGSPATGIYDLRFTVYDALSGGSVIAGPLVIATGVTNGLFTVTLDFGSGVFTGPPRWLEIAARTNGTTTFTTLTPRQAVLPTPYSVMASTASNLLGTLTAAQVSGGTANINISGTAANITGVLPVANGGTAASTAAGARADLGAAASGANADITSLSALTSLSVGSVNVNNNNLYLPATTASAGIIYSGGSRFIHAYGSDNFFAGYYAGNFAMSGNANTGVGAWTLWNNTSGSANTACGDGALSGNTNGSWNTANGINALLANTSGSENTASGSMALLFNLTGSLNTASGYRALYTNTSGSVNAAVGSAALYHNTTGSYNTAVGDSALFLNTTGTNNIAIGYQAGYWPSTGNNNIYIGNGNPGFPSDNNVIRIGDPALQTATYLAGTVYASGVSASTSTGYGLVGQGSGSGWAGLLRYGTDGNNSAYLGGNGNAAVFYGTVTVNGTFNNNSDRNAKENFTKVQAADMLAKVAQLPVTEWNYKNDAATRHIGPMAQDFYAAFNVGTDERHIAPIDETGVALAAIQGLNQKLEQQAKEKDAEIQDLKQSVAELKVLVEKLAGK